MTPGISGDRMAEAETNRPGSDHVAVSARGLVRVFGAGEARVEALRGVDLDVPKATFLAVMGPSGAGKSALLHLLGGLDRPTKGRVLVAGTDLSTLSDDALTILRRRRIGFVFQAFNLIQALSAVENVALPLVVDGVPARDATNRALPAGDAPAGRDVRGRAAAGRDRPGPRHGPGARPRRRADREPRQRGRW
jgi:ABC-type glutathione transport system ATPase component